MSIKLTESNNILDLNPVFAKRNALRKEAETLKKAADEPVNPEDISGVSQATAALIAHILNDHPSVQ